MKVAIFILDAERDSWNTAYEREVTYKYLSDYGIDYEMVYSSEPLPKPKEVDLIDIKGFCCRWHEYIARIYQVPIKPIISTVEETSLSSLFGVLRRNNIDLKFMLNRIKHYISRSTWSRDMLIHGFQISGDHITYIPHGVDLKLFKPTMKEPEDNSFLYVGSLNKNNGIDILLNAYKQIASKTDWGLTIIGGFSNSECIVADIKRYAKENKKIQFVPSPPPLKELMAYYQKASVFVQPKSYNGEPLQFCHPVLWAIACGLPAISLDIGAPRDYIRNGENGFLCQKYKEMPERMLEITGMSWREMGNVSRVIAEKNHDPKKIGAKYKEVYEAIDNNKTDINVGNGNAYNGPPLKEGGGGGTKMGKVDKTDVEVGIGISTYNGPHRVEDLLVSIEQHTKYDGEYGIVVIDDGSREENLVKLREICNYHLVPLREHRENLGISVTWNHLTRFFNSEYMILLNDDLIMVDDWLTSLVFFLKNNKCGTAGLPLYFGRPGDESITILKHGQWKGHPEGVDSEVKPGRVMAAPGCCFGFKRSLFDEIGGFDEQYISFYEEIDFGTECAKRGYPSYAMSYPRIYHLWSATFAQNPELKAEERMSKSRIYYIEKWGGDHDVTNPRYMNAIPPQKIKWWTPYNVMEAMDVE